MTRTCPWLDKTGVRSPKTAAASATYDAIGRLHQPKTPKHRSAMVIWNLGIFPVQLSAASSSRDTDQIRILVFIHQVTWHVHVYMSEEGKVAWPSKLHVVRAGKVGRSARSFCGYLLFARGAMSRDQASLMHFASDCYLLSE